MLAVTTTEIMLGHCWRYARWSPLSAVAAVMSSVTAAITLTAVTVTPESRRQGAEAWISVQP